MSGSQDTNDNRRLERGSRNHRYSPSGGKARASVIISDRSLGIVALVLSIVLLVFCYGLWNRIDLLMIYYRDIKGALIQHGVNPHPHLPNEAP